MTRFAKIKRQMAFFDHTWEIGALVDCSSDPQYWAHWVDNGTAAYLTPEEMKEIPQHLLTQSLGCEILRPLKYLTSLATNVTRIEGLEDGSFNAGLIEHPKGYLLVYRPTEISFAACILNKQFKPIEFHPLNTVNCADPRLVRIKNQIFIVYSSFNHPVLMDKECIRAQLIMEDYKWVDYSPFRVSPEELPRQKNWMPFNYEDRLYFISDVHPHTVWEWTDKGPKKQYQTNWDNPWFEKVQLRGNTNAVQLEDGNYFSTFHTAKQIRGCTYYDNGAYIFEGKPPFKVLKATQSTYLPAESAIEPHYRKEDVIRCNFPVGLVREGNDLLISYGDNDSCVKIMKTTVQEMGKLMIDQYI